MYCPHCGKQIDDNVNYCPYCGRAVRTDRPEERPPRPPEPPRRPYSYDMPPRRPQMYDQYQNRPPVDQNIVIDQTKREMSRQRTLAVVSIILSLIGLALAVLSFIYIEYGWMSFIGLALGLISIPLVNRSFRNRHRRTSIASFALFIAIVTVITSLVAAIFYIIDLVM